MPLPTTVDLDGAVTPRAADDADLSLAKASTSSDPVVAPGPKSTLAVGGAGAPTPDRCTAAKPTAAPVPISTLRQGSVLCVQTDQGHLAVVHVDQIPAEKTPLKATYETYEKP